MAAPLLLVAAKIGGASAATISKVQMAQAVYGAIKDCDSKGGNTHSCGNAAGGLLGAVGRFAAADMMGGISSFVGGKGTNFSFNADGSASVASPAGRMDLSQGQVAGQRFEFGEGVQVQDARAAPKMAGPSRNGATMINAGGGTPRGPNSLG